MIPQLNEISNIWWQWMGGMFWQVSLLIILVTLLDIAIRRLAWPPLAVVVDFDPVLHTNFNKKGIS